MWIQWQRKHQAGLHTEHSLIIHIRFIDPDGQFYYMKVHILATTKLMIMETVDLKSLERRLKLRPIGKISEGQMSRSIGNQSN